MIFIFKKTNRDNNHVPERIKTPVTAKSCASELLFMNIAQAEEDNLEYDYNEEIREVEKKNELNKEISEFSQFYKFEEFLDINIFQ
jgi:hypothetical protein